jgi:DNA-binding CsgD family transcriptional regulator
MRNFALASKADFRMSKVLGLLCLMLSMFRGTRGLSPVAMDMLKGALDNKRHQEIADSQKTTIETVRLKLGCLYTELHAMNAIHAARILLTAQVLHLPPWPKYKKTPHLDSSYRNVLDIKSRGYTCKEIAELVYVGVATIRRRLLGSYTVLGVKALPQAVGVAHRTDNLPNLSDHDIAEYIKCEYAPLRQADPTTLEGTLHLGQRQPYHDSTIPTHSGQNPI